MKKLKEIIRHFHNNKYKNSLYDFELNKKYIIKKKIFFTKNFKEVSLIIN